MELEVIIRDIVRSEIEAAIGSDGSNWADPELITIAETAAAAGCGKDVINALIKDAPANGFPVIHLGPKTIRIDKRRLAQWLSRGGLEVKV